MISLRSDPIVFAVEDTSAQLTWRHLPGGPITVRCGPSALTFDSDGGPGTCDLVGLEPGTSQRAEFRLGSSTTGEPIAVVAFRTLTPPPGPELFRFSTFSDLHLGTDYFGLRHKIREPEATMGHPMRCAAAAARQMLAWGSTKVIIKGDLVHESTPQCWALAAELIAGIDIETLVLPGNHEMAHGTGTARELARHHGIDLLADVTTVDEDGIRLVLMDSTVDGIDIGRWHHLRDDVADAAGGAAGPAMVLTHHQPQSTPFPLYFPPGIDSLTAGKFVRTLAAANPASMGSSGHTHRNRRRDVAGIPWTEVGSPKDYPGSWAGYVVHEGGIRQVVRRVSEPDCLQWLDRTRTAAAGVWGLWSPGRLSDRCFSHTWPRRQS